jgi:hypothetical protein
VIFGLIKTGPAPDETLPEVEELKGTFAVLAGVKMLLCGVPKLEVVTGPWLTGGFSDADDVDVESPLPPPLIGAEVTLPDGIGIVGPGVGPGSGTITGVVSLGGLGLSCAVWTMIVPGVDAPTLAALSDDTTTGETGGVGVGKMMVVVEPVLVTDVLAPALDAIEAIALFMEFTEAKKLLLNEFVAFDKACDGLDVPPP